MSVILEAKSLQFGYAAGQPFSRAFDFALEAGEVRRILLGGSLARTKSELRICHVRDAKATPRPLLASLRVVAICRQSKRLNGREGP